MSAKTAKILVVTDGVQSFYLLKGERGYHGKAALHAGSAVLTFVRATAQYDTGWWRADGPPAQVTIVSPGPKTKVGYKLRNPNAESAAFPLNLTCAESAALGFDDDTMTALYTATHEDGPDDVRTITVDSMTIIEEAFEPAPEDGLAWVPNVIDALRAHIELHHLFPGHLTGFREAVVQAVRRLDFMSGRGMFDAGAYEKDGHLVAHASTPYEPRHTRFVHAIGRNGQKLKRGRDVAEAKTLRVSFAIPAAIAGANRAEAVQRWHETIARICAEVTEALTPAPCWHCGGTGIVAANSAERAAS